MHHFLVLFALALFSAPTMGEIIRVGSGLSCDSSNLAQAVSNAPSGATIRVANNLDYNGVSLLIADKSLTIVGGFNRCDSPSPSSRTTLGPGTSRAINIAFANSVAREVTLENLEITGASGSSDGAGIRLSDRTRLTLVNTLVHGNTTTGNGGGIWMNGPVSQRLVIDDPNTRIYNNSAAFGGGIYCDESSTAILNNGQIEIRAGEVSGNNASLDGGGLYLEDCDLLLTAGGPESGDGGIIDNEAERRGGGIYFTGDSHVTLLAGDTPGRFGAIKGNYAENDGGGLYCNRGGGDRPSLTIRSGLVAGNQTEQSGGGIWMSGCDGEINASGPVQGIQGNQSLSTSGLATSAIRLSQGSVLSIDGGNRAFSPANEPVYIRNNQSQGGQGVIYVNGSELQLVDVHVTDNGARTSAGISVITSSLLMTHSDDGACRSNGGLGGCSQLSRNGQNVDVPNAASANVGIQVLGGGNGPASARVERTEIRDNYGSGNSYLFRTDNNGNDALLELDTVLVTNNLARRLVDQRRGDRVRVLFSTLVDNQSVIANDIMFQLGADSELDLISSIIWQSEPGHFGTPFRARDFSSGQTVDHEVNVAFCVQIHALDALEEFGYDNGFLNDDRDPLFANLALGDYRVLATSPVVRCSNDEFSGLLDLVGFERGVNVDGLPLLTAGAYSVRSDWLHRDRFEDGLILLQQPAQ